MARGKYVLIVVALLLVSATSARRFSHAADKTSETLTAAVTKCQAGGDGGPATEAHLCYPYDVVVHVDGSLYIADRVNHRIRKIDPAGIITTVAGNGERGSSGDGGPATDARLNYPSGIAMSADGNLYIADTYSQRIRKVDATGVITTVAGKGWPPGYSGDGGPATEAGLYYPAGVAVAGDGTLYIADRGCHRIRKVDPAGIITTLAGNGESAYSGDGGPATESKVSWSFGLAVDAEGNLYIADQNNQRVRRIDTAGIITTLAGNGERGYSGDGGPATEASLRGLYNIAVAGDGSLYIADTKNHRIRKVDPEGVITTVAGTGEKGFSGDGGPASEANINSPCGVAVGEDGSLYIADSHNHRVRKVDPGGIISTIAGGG